MRPSRLAGDEPAQEATKHRRKLACARASGSGSSGFSYQEMVYRASADEAGPFQTSLPYVNDEDRGSGERASCTSSGDAFGSGLKKARGARHLA
jgi:hypothetical protein